MQRQSLRYFTALAQTSRFANAAVACGVFQLILSAGLPALEHDPGKRLVERDRRPYPVMSALKHWPEDFEMTA